MRKICILLLVVMNTVLLSGCWDRTEINDIAIVTAVGIDKTENGDISLSLLIPIPKMISSGGASGNGGGKDKPSTLLVSESGKSVVDAFRKIQAKLPREVTYSHIRVIIIGEKLAQDGVDEVLDFFSRYRQSNFRAHVLFTKENIDEVLEGNSGIEESVVELMREEGQMGGLGVDLKDFIDMLNEEGKNPVAGQLVKMPLAVNQKQTEKSKPDKPYYSIKGAAVFHKDRLIGWIDDDEVRGVLLFRDEVKSGVGMLTINIPEEKGGGKIGIRVLKSKTILQPVMNEDVLTMGVFVDTKTEVFDNSSNLDLTDAKSIYYIEKIAEKHIEKRMQLVLDKLQKQLQSDVIGFGKAVYQKYPQEWGEQYKENWHEEFSKINVELAAKIQVQRVGFVTNSLMRKEEEIKK